MGRQSTGMIHQIAVTSIHSSPTRIFNPKGLHGGDDDGHLTVQLCRFNVKGLLYVKDIHRSCRIFHCLPVGMLAVAEGIYRLFQDGIGRHQPQDNRAFRMQQLFGGNPDTVTGDNGLAAAGGYPQAHIR